MRALPPLNALRVFEVAARTGSFTQAARELGLTHGAVSRQVMLLEAWLGQRLFVRTGRRMVATPAAQAFAGEVSLAFDRVSTAADACGRPAARRILRISAPATFAMRWLIPRLEAFHAERPEVEVTVTTTTTLHEALGSGFDVAIRRGSSAPSAWPRYQVTRFLSEWDTLIIGRDLFERQPIRALEDIGGHVLLASETREGDWADWLDAANLSHLSAVRRRVFDHFFVTLQAITDGLGIGIGPFPVLARDAAAGRLVLPFPAIRVPRTGYVALVPIDADKSPSLRALIDWLVSEGTSPDDGLACNAPQR